MLFAVLQQGCVWRQVINASSAMCCALVARVQPTLGFVFLQFQGSALMGSVAEHSKGVKLCLIPIKVTTMDGTQDHPSVLLPHCAIFVCKMCLLHLCREIHEGASAWGREMPCCCKSPLETYSYSNAEGAERGLSSWLSCLTWIPKVRLRLLYFKLEGECKRLFWWRNGKMCPELAL